MFLLPVRIYYEDTDSGGVVYYANYLKFMERARTEWLRNLGYEQDVLARDMGIIFAVRTAELDFLRPGRFNELLHVSVEVAARGSASLTFAQKVLRFKDNTAAVTKDVAEEATVLCQGRIKIACVDRETMKPKRIPVNLAMEIGDER